MTSIKMAVNCSWKKNTRAERVTPECRVGPKVQSVLVPLLVLFLGDREWARVHTLICIPPPPKAIKTVLPVWLATTKEYRPVKTRANVLFPADHIIILLLQLVADLRGLDLVCGPQQSKYNPSLSPLSVPRVQGMGPRIHPWYPQINSKLMILLCTIIPEKCVLRYGVMDL